MDMVFQSIAGTEAANSRLGFKASICSMRRHPRITAAARMGRGGQRQVTFGPAGKPLSGHATSRGGQQPRESAKRTRWREKIPVRTRNTGVGFIGNPEYLFDGKQILRAGMEGDSTLRKKCWGWPMGLRRSVPPTTPGADQDDMGLCC